MEGGLDPDLIAGQGVVGVVWDTVEVRLERELQVGRRGSVALTVIHEAQGGGCA